ncbi:MAG: hypothetical protein HUK09_01780 [Bacteroidaceae bacterium]|nr:hypothetical protein [Bacteroidaceae bacterium]
MPHAHRRVLGFANAKLHTLGRSRNTISWVFFQTKGSLLLVSFHQEVAKTAIFSIILECLVITLVFLALSFRYFFPNFRLIVIIARIERFFGVLTKTICGYSMRKA